MSVPQNNPPGPTRILSWQQQVVNADPRWQYGLYHPWTYQFSNGRRFQWDPNVYTDPDT